MPREVECKFLDVDHARLRELLQAAGARREGMVFESNEVWDWPDRRLRREGTLLRLRQHAGSEGESCILTCKLRKGESTSELKILEELETRVQSAATLAAILSALGLQPALRYEKVRETWHLAGVHVCLDLLPFGRYLELEGEPEAIQQARTALELTRSDPSAATYLALHHEHLRRQGLPLEDSFVFAPELAAILQARVAAGESA